MSGIASDHLFHLIKSLNGSEKRYFKTFTLTDSDQGNSIYIQLFNAIGNQNKYDEKAILRRKKTIRPAQLSNLKKYLHELVLRSLRSYHSGKSIDIKLRGLLDSIEILYDKRLAEQCHKLISKAKQMAYKYEKNSLLVDILFWEERIIAMGPTPGKPNLSAIPVYDSLVEVIGKLKSTTEYTKTFRIVVETFRKEGILRNKRSDGKLKNLMLRTSLKSESHLLSYHDRFYYYSIHSVYNLLNANWNVHYKYQKKVVDLIERHPEQIEDSLNTYLASLNTFLICSQFTRHYDELQSTFEKVRSITLKQKNVLKGNSLVQVLGCYNSMMHFYTQNGDFEKGVKLFREIEARFDPSILKLNKSLELSIYYTLAYTFFGVKNYKASLHWLNKILNTQYPEGVRDDIQSFARIFNLILHYELGNKNLLEYIVKSTYRFLYKRKRLYRLESLVLNFIRKNSWVNTRADLLVSFKGLKDELVKIQNNSYEKKALSYFNLLAWLESKTGGKSFSEVMRANYAEG